ncbi:MAG: type II toxin-antitoxin system prevent-host-death family antitoxin [Actinomycetota bacterium]|nr:type II toxin-antitoxin system prevent-host-death family antitoxin [Actinomycetota bacterium]
MATMVSASEYRANLRRWHERVARGEDIVVTDNGEPIVQVVPAEAEALLVRLEREGLLRRARGRRPSAEIVSVPAAGDSATTVSADRDR